MRFLADMGISPATVGFLRDQGHDAVHLRDRHLQTLPDPQILQLAAEEGRILLTHDLDFSDLLASEPGTLPCVVIFRLRSMQPDNVNRHLKAILSDQASALRQNVVASVTEGRVRIRTLPFGEDE